MVIKRIYIAKDGKEFDNETQCLDYEDLLNAQQFKDTAFLYDKNGKTLPLKKESFDNTHYIVAKTDEAAYFMKKFFEGWYTPWNCDNIAAGCWVYNNDEWISAKTILDMADIIKRIF